MTSGPSPPARPGRCSTDPSGHPDTPRWTLVFVALFGAAISLSGFFLPQSDAALSAVLLVVSLFLTGLLCFHVHTALSCTRALTQTAADRTRELAEANARLQAEAEERSRTQRVASETENLLAAILDNSTAVIYVKNTEGRFMLINREFERLFHVRREQVVGKTDFDLFPREAAEAFRANDLRSLGSKAPVEFEELAPVEGVERTYLSLKFPLSNPEGQDYAICGISTDITERAHAEKALKDSEALYQSLAECLPLNLIRKDTAGRITYCNERYCKSMGSTAEELLGKTDFDLYPSNLAQKYVDNDRDVISQGQIFEDVEAYHSPEGEDLYMHVLKSPVHDASGRNVGLQVVFWDVTDRVRAEKELERTAEDLGRSNRELELFAYVASHDLQEPLRMIASYTQLLQRRYQDRLDEEANEFIGYAVDGAVRMQNLINDLLTYSRVGTREKKFDKVDLGKVLENTLQNLSLAIKETGAEITHNDFPAVTGDGVQLGQVLQNLISNALKFHGEAAPRIRLQAVEEDDHWLFSVQDNGIGIGKDYFERIFVVFQRLHNRQEYPGTGIGLAICKKIVERHGGRIWVESTENQGSTFHFTLPLKNTAPRPAMNSPDSG